MESKLDESDRIILDILQNDAGSTINAMVDDTGLSVASVQRRLKRLRSNGVIDREVAILNADALGQKMTFIVMVELERESLDQLDAFRRKIANEQHVQQCYYVTGDADFVLICLVPDMKAFEELTHRLFFKNQNVRRFHTNVVMSRTKVGLSVPIWPETNRSDYF
jgi:DNA-binding Lrp family transcriptional regulator